MVNHWKRVSCALALGFGAVSGVAQSDIPQLLDEVRPSVVRIEIIVPPGFNSRSPSAGPPNIPDGIKRCFGTRPWCIVGTGIFVNNDGDVLTASHVAKDSEAVIELLRGQGIAASLMVGVSLPNFETTRGFELSSSATLYPATVAAVDAAHDVALIHLARNPFRVDPNLAFRGPSSDSPKWTLQVVTFSTQRPREAEPVIACGFPLGEVTLVTTTGTIASAWFSHVPLTATSPNAEDIDTYEADLRINPGNSGGPVFSVVDKSVIGIVVEYGGGPGGLAIIVPSKYLVDFLGKQKVSWHEARSQKPAQPGQH